MISTSTEGTGVAGSPYSIMCTVTKLTALLATPAITWVNPSGIVLSGQTNSTQVGSVSVFSVTVQFTPLLASSAGMYTCEASLVSSLLNAANLTSTTMVTAQCKLWPQ